MPSGHRHGPPDPGQPVFFLDRGLGRHIVANAIRARGFEAFPMADVYPGGQDLCLPDPEWIRRADREGWVVISKDKAVLRDHADVLAAVGWCQPTIGGVIHSRVYV